MKYNRSVFPPPFVSRPIRNGLKFACINVVWYYEMEKAGSPKDLLFGNPAVFFPQKIRGFPSPPREGLGFVKKWSVRMFKNVQ
ncbi:hypothetical protein ANRL4_01022 [Anaerolineae bacterium]|nr:hypothetical protein ANRL4_01022 [Anaerolineae bacterium]